MFYNIEQFSNPKWKYDHGKGFEVIISLELQFLSDLWFLD
jgi:hypothetical protein